MCLPLVSVDKGTLPPTHPHLLSVGLRRSASHRAQDPDRRPGFLENSIFLAT